MFRPWLRNRLAAVGLFGLSVGCPVAGYAQGHLFWQGAALGVCCLVLGIAQWGVARKRNFGKTFETRAISQAMYAFRADPAIRLQPCVSMNGREDIDLVILAGGEKVPVEIKSFVVWKTYFWRIYGIRERHSIAQSRRQARHLGSRRAIIWLPQGRRGFWHRFSTYPAVASRTVLVFGHARNLRGSVLGEES